MSHTVWFDIPLICLCCRQDTPGKKTQMYTSGLLIEPMDSFVEKGGELESELADFKESYLYQHLPEGADFFALEQWHCPHCCTTQWAKLQFHQTAEDSYQFVDATVVALDTAGLAGISFFSRKAADWVQDNPGAETNALREAMEGHYPE